MDPVCGLVWQSYFAALSKIRLRGSYFLTWESTEVDSSSDGSQQNWSVFCHVIIHDIALLHTQLCSGIFKASATMLL